MPFFNDQTEFNFLRRSYIIKRRLDINPLREALDSYNFEFIITTVSPFIENAKMYGFPKIESFAILLKKASVAEDTVQLELLLKGLNHLIHEQELKLGIKNLPRLRARVDS